MLDVIVENKSVKIMVDYPLLKICKSNNVIVLFTDESTGVVVDRGGSPHRNGHYSVDWMERLFTIFDGSVVLKNRTV